MKTDYRNLLTIKKDDRENPKNELKVWVEWDSNDGDYIEKTTMMEPEALFSNKKLIYCLAYVSCPYSFKGHDWNDAAFCHHITDNYDIEELNALADKYFMDEEVTANSAVFEYVLMGCPADKRNMLVLRAFTAVDKSKMYKMQGGIDPIDGEKYKLEEMDAHHIVAWENGGKTELSNGVLISKANHKKIVHAELKYNAEQIRQMRDELLERVKASKK